MSGKQGNLAEKDEVIKLEYLKKSSKPVNTAPVVKFSKEEHDKLNNSGYLLPPEQNEQIDFYNEIQTRQSNNGKLMQLIKSNPFVPLGCLVTVGILINGIFAMKNKDKLKSQRMMRWRIAAQGSTIIAMVAGPLIIPYIDKLASKFKA